MADLIDARCFCEGWGCMTVSQTPLPSFLHWPSHSILRLCSLCAPEPDMAARMAVYWYPEQTAVITDALTRGD